MDDFIYYWMIHELGSIPFSKQEGALKSCTKWKFFIGRKRAGKGSYLQKRKHCFRPSHLFGGSENGRGLIV